jgi:hypothetical protein
MNKQQRRLPFSRASSLSAERKKNDASRKNASIEEMEAEEEMIALLMIR